MVTQNSLNNQTVNANFTVNRTDSGSQAIDAVVHSQNTAGSDAVQKAQVPGTAGGDPFVELVVGASRNWILGPQAGDPSQRFVIGSSVGSSTPSTTNGAIVITPYTSGSGGHAVWRVSQPTVLAYKSATSANQTGNGTFATVIFDAVLYDQAGEYNNATGIFTASQNGTYLFEFGVSIENIGAGHTSGSLSLALGPNRWYVDSGNYFNMSIQPGGFYTSSGSFVNGMPAGTTAAVQTQVSNSTLTVGVSGNVVPTGITWFAAYFMG